MKKILRLSLVLLVLLGLTVVAGWLALNPIVKNQIEAAGTRGTGVLTTVRAVSTSPLAGTATLEGLTLANPGGFDGAIFEANQTRLRVDVGTLFANEVVLPSVSIDGGTVWVSLRNGRLNVTELQELLAREPNSGADSRGYFVHDLRVRNVSVLGEIAVAGLPAQQIRFSLDDIQQTNIRGENLGQMMGEVIGAVMADVGVGVGEFSPDLVGLVTGLGDASHFEPEEVEGALDTTMRGVENTADRVLDGLGGLLDGLEEQVDSKKRR